MREIEAKFLVPAHLSKPELDHTLRSILPALHRESFGASTDYYFRSNGPADFVRLRVDDEGYVELCTTVRDNGDTLDRLEVELHFGQDDAAGRTSRQLLRLALGQELTRIRKTAYTEFELDGGTVVSTYTVEGFDHVILEVEGTAAAEVWHLVTHIKSELEKLSPGVALRPEPRSIFEMFVKPLLGVPT
jgi:hypothetical protein